MTGTNADVESVHRALWSAFKLLSDHAVSFVLVSFAWSVAVLPVVTVGPATLGAYAAVRSIRDEGCIDRGEVLATLRSHWLDALLLGGVLVATSTMSLLYFGRYVATGSPIAGALGAGGTYVSVHLGLVMVSTFVGLSGGTDLFEAVKTSYRWTVTRPTVTISVLILTSLLFVGSAALTIAVVIVFPALAAAFHTELLAPVFESDAEAAHDEQQPSPTRYSGTADA